MTTNRIIDAVRVRDQLGKPDNTAIFGPFRKQEILKARETPTIVITYDTSVGARWDDAGTTWDGPDLNDKWLDYSDSNIRTFSRIVNNDNEFYWNFNQSEQLGDDNKQLTYGFIGSNNTCTIDTTNLQATFTSGQILEIVSAFKDSSSSQVVTAATLNVTIDSGSFDLEMSANGGSNWETVTNNTTHIFTNTGSDLRIRITENNTSTGTISLVRCSYVI
jgi:hypothetical protein